MVHYADSYRARINDLATQSELARAEKEALASYLEQCKTSLVKSGRQPGDVVDPEVAGPILLDIHANILHDLEQRVKGYSAVRWLFMLRRVPKTVFAGRLYDQRCAIDRNAWSAAGTDLFDEVAEGTGSLLVANRIGLATLQMQDGNLIDATAMPRLISTNAIAALTQKVSDVADTPWPVESALAVWIARAVNHYFIELHEESAVMRQILNVGYLPMGEETLAAWIEAVAAECNQFVKDVVGHSLEISSHKELLAKVAALPGGVWPLLPRNMAPRMPEVTCIDLCSAGYAISESLEYTNDAGATANIRAGHFEAAVQRKIDDTNWKPEGEDRKLIGRKLKKNGAEVTDIDAVATYKSILVLVSCKSRRKSGLYDIGDFSTVRNAASLMETAVDKWEKVIAGIRQNPTGYNVDFSRYTKVIGVVCTSSVFYGPVDVVTPNLPDGVRVLALNELIEWLEVEATKAA